MFLALPNNLLANGKDAASVIVVVGAGGEDEFGKQFETWAKDWEKAAKIGGAQFKIIGTTNSGKDDKDVLREAIETESKGAPNELWLVLLGHGTFDGKEAKFNLRGPDVSGGEIAKWLVGFQRPIAIINASSSSAPFINALSGPNRVIVTATKSGSEMNFARFGEHISRAIVDKEADLDKDGQTSLLEAYLSAGHRTEEFYKSEGRLATEHALLDDNGDSLGTPGDWFRGVRAVKRAREGASIDGLRAHQFHLVRSEQEQKMPPAIRAKRDQLELDLARLRDHKASTPEAEYYDKLEKILLQLARLYQQIDSGAPSPGFQ